MQRVKSPNLSVHLTGRVGVLFSNIVFSLNTTSVRLVSLPAGDFGVSHDKMTKVKRKQAISMFLSVGCLLIGSAIYVLFRPSSLLMFHFADSVGLTGTIGIMRASVDGFDRYLPTWVVYSLPFALWVSSCQFFIRNIWQNSTSLVCHLWYWCIPLFAVAAELAQSMHVIPGRFDIEDLIALILGTMLCLLLTHFSQLNKGVTKS